MQSLDQLYGRVSSAFKKRAARMRMATYFVKVVMIGAGTALVSFSTFWTLQANEKPNAFNYIGAGASLIVLLGAIVLALAEEDPSKELYLAQQGLDRARDLKRATDAVWQQVDTYAGSVDRLTELFTAYDRMRDVLEEVAVKGTTDELAIIDFLMTAAGRHLTIGMGFQHSDDWTLSVYQAVDLPAGTYLVSRAHARAIHCPVNEARKWRVGVGVGGVAFAAGNTIIVPDMQAEGVGNLYSPADEKPYDTTRYRSIVAVPVKVSDEARPWGIVIGTSSVPLHFKLQDTERPANAQGAATLAAMVALAVAFAAAAKRPRGGPETGQEPVSAGT